jgi:hypothetical protein
MKMQLMFCVLFLFVIAFTAGADVKYQAVEIQTFEVTNGIEFPSDYLISLHEDLKAQLEKLNKFSEVRVMSTGSPGNSELKTLKIAGQITEYKPGSKVGRALFGMLAGETKVEAKIQVFDAASGVLLFTDDVDGKVTYWSPDQDSKGATQGLAKEVAKVIKKKFF